MSSTKTLKKGPKLAQPSQPKTEQDSVSVRLFRNWWLTDIRKTWFGLLAISVLGIGANAIVVAVALVYVPGLYDLFFTKSISGAFQASITIIGSPWLVLVTIVILAVVNILFISWVSVFLHKKITSKKTLPNNTKRRILNLFYVVGIALIILIAITVIGTGLAYGFSRWYFGIVIPILLITIALLLLFTVWFSFLPFIVIWEGIFSSPALSISRQRVRKATGRIVFLTILLIAMLLIIFIELDGFNPWLKLTAAAFLIPIYISLLATLYSETRSQTFSE